MIHYNCTYNQQDRINQYTHLRGPCWYLHLPPYWHVPYFCHLWQIPGDGWKKCRYISPYNIFCFHSHLNFNLNFYHLENEHVCYITNLNCLHFATNQELWVFTRDNFQPSMFCLINLCLSSHTLMYMFWSTSKLLVFMFKIMSHAEISNLV